MSYFFDSSAIAKRYHQEAGSSRIQEICKPSTKPVLYLAALARVEVSAALRRAGHDEGQHPALVAARVAEFRRHLRTTYRLVPLSDDVLDIAAALCDMYWHPHPLRTLDAIQIACAITVRAEDLGVIFVTADTDMEEIARQEQFQVINPLYT